MAKVGRPTKQTDKITNELFGRLASGESVASICSDKHMPDERTYYRWMHQEDFCQASLRAREKGSHALADQTLKIADDPDIDAQQKRIMVDTRMRLMGMWNKIYNNKLAIDHTTQGEKINGKNLSDEELMAIAEKAKDDT